jgi:hypothetical protein
LSRLAKDQDGRVAVAGDDQWIDDQYDNCHDGVGAVAALAVRELTWGFLTHSAFDLGRTITLGSVGAQRTPGLPPDI